jgi:hypothetical protein
MNYILTDKGLTIFIDGQPLSVARSDTRWDACLEALRAVDERRVAELLMPAKLIAKFTSDSGLLRIEGGALKYNDCELPNESYFVRKILHMHKEGFPVAPLAAFIENLMLNPSFRARRELLQFLEYGDLPITSDGHFLAYKRVRYDYKDCHSASIDNSVGQIVEMPRVAVDDDSNNTCSSGLHFCSREYLRSFTGSRLMVLKISPQDVVSIPADYNNTKGRCCRYEVVGELEMTLDEKNAWEQSVVSEYDDEHDDEYDDEIELKIGSRVRIIGNGNLTGYVGTISKIHGDSAPQRMMLIKVDTGDQHWVTETELELE